MTRNTLCCILILSILTSVTKGDLQDLLNLQHRTAQHLPDKKFGSSDYAEYPEADDFDQAGSNPLWDTVAHGNAELSGNPAVGQTQTNATSTFDPNIKWDNNWGGQLNYGQLSAVDIDQNGNIALFTRRERVWGQSTFDLNEVFNRKNGPIKQNTIILLNKHGKIIAEWGKNMFYLPHGLTIDYNGNYWLTDVAMHQVFKFDGAEIQSHIEQLKQSQNQPEKLINIAINGSIIKASMVLGVPFEPGTDNRHFCKPTAVAVANNGDFFVSDGYCNSRIIKFNNNGERILTIGRGLTYNDNFPSPYSLYVPHALAIANELEFIYVADREHGRILCYSSQNGTFHREYKNPLIGTRIYSVAYARERIYLVNGNTPYTFAKFHVRGFVIDINTGNVVSQFGPNGDMIAPHDIAVTTDGSEIYVPELDKPMIYRFLQGNTANLLNSNSMKLNNFTELSRRRLKPLVDDNTSNESSKGTNATTIILTIALSAMILIALCIAVAAVVARCHKRGCLLSMRKRGYWANDKNDNFTLSSLLDLDKRPNTRDFSKLNTEPETSEDEHVEDSLII